jgi:hypothetical protein
MARIGKRGRVASWAHSTLGTEVSLDHHPFVLIMPSLHESLKSRPITKGTSEPHGFNEAISGQGRMSDLHRLHGRLSSARPVSALGMLDG